jgi:hypothetical protein
MIGVSCPCPQKEGLKIFLKKHLRLANLLLSSPSISPMGENGGYGATDN